MRYLAKEISSQTAKSASWLLLAAYSKIGREIKTNKQTNTNFRERLFKKKTELADLEIFQSFKMTEDAKSNDSQAKTISRALR